MRLTAKERVLLHLLDYVKYREALEVPPEMTQEGIASAVWVELRHLSQYLRPLLDEETVRERTCHVRGIRQRRKVYDLTDSGQHAAYRLRDRVREATVRVRDAEGVREETVARATERLGGRVSLLELARRSLQAGTVDLETWAAPSASPFVEMIAEAPELVRFVGRQSELEAITREGGGPRVFVVRGMPGMGKTSLGSKACSLLRGRKNLFWHRVRPWESPLVVLSDLGRFLARLNRPSLAALVGQGDMGRIGEALRLDLPGTSAFLVFDDVQEASPELRSTFRMLLEAVTHARDVKVLILTRSAPSFYDRRAVTLQGLVSEMELAGLDPEDVATLLDRRDDALQVAHQGGGLAGLPLFAELIRTHPAKGAEPLRDAHRFLEEEVYRQLTNEERALMKVSSLFRVPIPRDTLLAVPGGSYETLLSLQDRGLLRSVGEDRYEVHDTIRDFFDSTLSQGERQGLSQVVAPRLMELGSAALNEGNPLGCIAYLSNAALLVRVGVEHAAIHEMLGDGYARIADLSSSLSEHTRALGSAVGPESMARLHRKMAADYLDHGEIVAAGRELEAGYRALGTVSCVERGWLDLLGARMLNLGMEYAEAETRAREALSAFERYGDLSGQARAWASLAVASDWTGSSTEDGGLLSDRANTEALRLAGVLRDAEFEARIRLVMVQSIGYRSGDYAEAMRQLATIQGSPQAWSNPRIRAVSHNVRAWFAVRMDRGLETVATETLEAEREAEKIHEAGILANAVYTRAVISHERGNDGEACRLYELAAARYTAAGLNSYAADAYLCAGFEALETGDLVAFRRVASTARELKTPSGGLADPFRQRILGALAALADGRAEEFERPFSEIFSELDGYGPDSLFQKTDRWWAEFYFSLGLRVLGREAEASTHKRRAVEIATTTHNLRGLRFIEGPSTDKVVRTLRETQRFS